MIERRALDDARASGRSSTTSRASSSRSTTVASGVTLWDSEDPNSRPLAARGHASTSALYDEAGDIHHFTTAVDIPLSDTPRRARRSSPGGAARRRRRAAAGGALVTRRARTPRTASPASRSSSSCSRSRCSRSSSIEFTDTAQVETHLALSARNALQATYLARSGVNVAEALVQRRRADQPR